MSLETKLAQSAARDAWTVWLRHAMECPQCGNPKMGRCQEGYELHDVADAARKAAKESARLDRQPIDGQAILF